MTPVMASKIEHWPLERLVPYARNARTHSAAQVEQIARSIQRFGFTNPILVDGAQGILGGHGRLMAARSLKLPAVPVIVLDHLTEAERRAYIIADNQLALNAGWDDELLEAELREIQAMDFDLGVIGFDEVALERMLASEDDAEVADECPAVPENPITRPGDIWLCADHRVLCGDCRNSDAVARLTRGETVQLVFTSPPYASQREYDPSSGFVPIPPDEYVQWYAPVAAIIRTALARDGSYFLNIKPAAAGVDTELYVFDLVLAHARAWGFHFATEFCWERNGVPKSVTQRFKNQFEPIYQFALDRWKMTPERVQHPSDNVPRAGGAGSGDTSWATHQGGDVSFFGAAKKRRNGTSQRMSAVQGECAAPGEYIAPGWAYPGNRLPTFCASHDATGHAAAFPAGLPEWFIKVYSDPGDAVYDPFAGSGSVLIAADKQGRRGLMSELSANYCDVIVQRWQNYTGK